MLSLSIQLLEARVWVQVSWWRNVKTRKGFAGELQNSHGATAGAIRHTKPAEGSPRLRPPDLR